MYDSITHNSILLELAKGDGPKRRSQLGRFIEKYGAPLRAHLIRKGLVDADSANDWVHDFLVEKFLEAPGDANFACRYLDKRSAYPSLKFRSYLLQALNCFAIDRIRQARRRPAGVNLANMDAIPDTTELAADSFQVDFANNLLNQAIMAVYDECQRLGQQQAWQAFELRVVRPARTGEPPIGYGELIERVGFKSPQEASNRLQTALRKFNRKLRELVAGYLPIHGEEDGDKEIESELRDLRAILSGPGNLRLTDVSGSDNQSSHDSLVALPAAMFEIDDHGDALWEDSELKEIWSHWLTRPLDALFSERHVALADRLSDVTVYEGFPLQNLVDLWQHPKPPLDALQALKREAKANIKRQLETAEDADEYQSTIGPTDLSVVIYLASIATAWTRLETRITKDSDQRFRERIERALTFTWLDDVTRDALQRWLDAM